MQSNPVAASDFMDKAMAGIDISAPKENNPHQGRGKFRRGPTGDQPGKIIKAERQARERRRANAKAAMRNRRLANA
jgi:hypothetical protein